MSSTRFDATATTTAPEATTTPAPEAATAAWATALARLPDADPELDAFILRAFSAYDPEAELDAEVAGVLHDKLPKDRAFAVSLFDRGVPTTVDATAARLAGAAAALEVPLDGMYRDALVANWGEVVAVVPRAAVQSLDGPIVPTSAAAVAGHVRDLLKERVIAFVCADVPTADQIARAVCSDARIVRKGWEITTYTVASPLVPNAYEAFGFFVVCALHAEDLEGESDDEDYL
eukprot:tig00021583_g22651.t1